MRTFSYLIILVVFCCSMPHLWLSLRGPSEQKWPRVLVREDQNPPDENVLKILDQPFRYWAEGSQCDVFLSEDSLYVLKIPRSSKRKFLVPGYSWKAKKKGPPRNALDSFRIASMHLSDETGSVYVRYGLLPQGLLPNLNLYDQLNRSIKIDLASVPFALQLRKELLSTVLAEMKDPEEAKLLLSALLDLIQLEQSKGFVSDDYAFTLNFGYANRKVVRIDLGGYAPFHAKFSLMRASKPIKRWLKKNYRLLVPWFEQEVASRERCSS